MKANPKKAAVLGLLGVIALYFWAPLMGGWFAGNDKPTPAASGVKPSVVGGGASTSATVESSSPAGSAIKSKEPQHTWQELAEWMEADPRTKPAAQLSSDCRPFQTPRPTAAVTRKGEPKPVTVEVTAQTANLVLSSTIVGGGYRAARINGKSYRPGDKIEIPLKSGGKLDFTVAEIQARSVILQRLDKKYELKIQAPKSSGTIELVGSTR